MIDEEGLQRNSLDVGTYFLDKLCGMRREWKIIGDVRGKGLMIGVELVDGDQDENENGQINPLNSRAISLIKNDCLKMGLLIGIGGVRSNVSIFMADENLNRFLGIRRFLPYYYRFYLYVIDKAKTLFSICSLLRLSLFIKCLHKK